MELDNVEQNVNYIEKKKKKKIERINPLFIFFENL